MNIFSTFNRRKYSSVFKIISLIFFSFFLLGTADSAEYEVKMLNKGIDGKMVFEPSVLKVNVGDTVTFIPADPLHDSISILTPDGANTWHGKRDQKVSVTINKEGVYIYKCAPHYYYGMVGVVHTGEATNINEAKEFAQNISSKFLVQNERLINYLEKIKID